MNADDLRLVGKAGGAAVRNCAEKLRYFIDYDAFPNYDRIGERHAHERDVFHPDLICAMNRAMMARSLRAAWAPFLNTPLPELEAIPTSVDLVESLDNEYALAREALRAYYLRLANVTWITDMAASKMLFLKRPRLAAISDSYIRKALAIPDPTTGQHPWKAPFCAERALRVSDAVRAVGRANIIMLQELQDAVKPTAVSKARILDILVWADMAITRAHRVRSTKAKQWRWTNSYFL